MEILCRRVCKFEEGEAHREANSKNATSVICRVVQGAEYRVQTKGWNRSISMRRGSQPQAAPKAEYSKVTCPGFLLHPTN
jgi:hypothetical protein